jgi:hypothetical protein
MIWLIHVESVNCFKVLIRNAAVTGASVQAQVLVVTVLKRLQAFSVEKNAAVAGFFKALTISVVAIGASAQAQVLVVTVIHRLQVNRRNHEPAR